MYVAANAGWNRRTQVNRKIQNVMGKLIFNVEFSGHVDAERFLLLNR